MYNNRPCEESVEIVETQSQAYGKCFSFVRDKPVTTSGQSYGLKLSYNIEVYDTIGLVTLNSGLKLYATPPGHYDWNGDIYIEKASEMSLAPGLEYSISVKPSKMEKLGAPYSDCENYKVGKLQNFNSKLDCQTFCVDKLANR